MAQYKILCLHGAMLSSSIFELQLAPYFDRLDTEYNCVLHFTDANLVTEPEPSIASFYTGPCYRFFHWAPSKTPFKMSQVHTAYTYLYEVIKQHGPFDGVMGFSQGAVISIALLLHHAQKHPDEPPDALFRFGIFFSCPHLPIEEDMNDTEEWGNLQLRIPTLHVCGEADDWFEASQKTFYERCEEGTRTMIMHKGGHVIPKDKQMVDNILVEIGKLLDNLSSGRDGQEPK